MGLWCDHWALALWSFCLSWGGGTRLHSNIPPATTAFWPPQTHVPHLDLSCTLWHTSSPFFLCFPLGLRERHTNTKKPTKSLGLEGWIASFPGFNAAVWILHTAQKQTSPVTNDLLFSSDFGHLHPAQLHCCLLHPQPQHFSFNALWFVCRAEK